MRLTELQGRKIAILGLGREGLAMRDCLWRAYPDQPVTLIDERDFTRPHKRFHARDRWLSGALEDQDLTQFDILIKSPGIGLYRGPIHDAKQAGVAVISSTQIWFSERPHGQVVAVTGSKGKSTTSALIAHLLSACGKSVMLAGNIGVPLISTLGRQADTWVVELSSYQIADLEAAPDIALLLNLFPEHLDWHGSEQRYYADKVRLLHQAGAVLVNRDMQESHWLDACRGEIHYFGQTGGIHTDDRGLYAGSRLLLPHADIPLLGEHNRLNCCAALAAADLAGCAPEQAAGRIPTFQPLPHRLQSVGQRHGVHWINDSIATAPQASLAALGALGGRSLTVLLGGYDRGLDWQFFAKALADNCPEGIICMGQNGPLIHRVLSRNGVAPANGLYLVEDLPQAVAQAMAATAPGGTVLLSPGAPSFPEFADFEQRGRAFTDLINTLSAHKEPGNGAP